MYNTSCYAPIGCFDSGIGGLTVASGIARQLPNEQIIYFGDSAHLPYGEKSRTAIQQYTRRIADFLLDKGCKIIVIACNTASAAAYEMLCSYVSGRALVVSVIEPVVQAVTQGSMQKVGIIATKSTIDSGMYPKLLKERNEGLGIVSKPTRSLVPLIEEGLFADQAIADAVIQHYLSDTKFQDIDALVLACTHYPLIKAQIRRHLPDGVQIFDSTDTVAWYVKKKLASHALLNPDTQRPPHEFYVSDYTPLFEQTAEMFFQQKISLQHAPIWEVDWVG